MSASAAYALREKAETLRREGDLPGALSELGRALALRPGDPAILGSRAEIRRRLKDFRGAERDAVLLMAASPRDPAGLLARAEARRCRGRFAEAGRDVEAALRLAPRSSWALLVKAKLLRALGRTEEAARACAKAARLDPRCPKARAWLGECLRALGRQAPARAALDEALRLDGTVAWARALRGALRADAGDPGAELDLEEAFATDPSCSAAYDFLGDERSGLARDRSCAWVWAWRGVARSRRGEAAGARDLARAARLAPRSAWILGRLGEALLAAGRLAEALAPLDRAIRLDPSGDRPRFWRGEARRRLGDLDGAAADMNLLLQSPEPEGACAALACLSRALIRGARGDRAGLVRDFARGVRLAPPSLAEKARAMLAELPADLRSEVESAAPDPGERALALEVEELFRRAEGRKARPRIRRALRRRPRSAALHLLLWRAKHPRGLGSRSDLSGLERALALGFEEPAAWSWLGAARLDQGRWEEGLRAMGRAAELDPARIWEHLGWPREARGMSRLAREAQLAALERVPGPLAAYFRARLSQNLGRHRLALAQLRAARPVFAACRWFWECAMGEALLKDGRFERALERLDRAVRFDPSQARALAWRGETLYWLGRPARALADFAAAVRAEPRASWVHAWRGQVLLWTGRYREAERALEEALALNPDNAWALGWRGAARALGGRPAEGLADLERCLMLEPKDAEALLFKAETLARSGRTAEALRALGAAARAEPGRLWLYPVRAWVLALADRPSGMLKDYEEARRLAPELFRRRRGTPSFAEALADVERALAAAKGNRTHRRRCGA